MLEGFAIGRDLYTVLDSGRCVELEGVVLLWDDGWVDVGSVTLCLHFYEKLVVRFLFRDRLGSKAHGEGPFWWIGERNDRLLHCKTILLGCAVYINPVNAFLSLASPILYTINQSPFTSINYSSPLPSPLGFRPSS